MVRQLAYERNRSYLTYSSYIEEAAPEVAANTVICLIHQTNYLLDQQLRQFSKGFSSRRRLYRKALQSANRRPEETIVLFDLSTSRPDAAGESQ